MTTYRKVYSKILESKDVNDMPDDFTRLTWNYLIHVVDREGRALDDPGYLRCKLYPRRKDVSEAMISSAMSWFAARGMIRRYSVKDESYFCVVNFGKYQGDTRRESASIYPPEGDESCITADKPQPGLRSEELVSVTNVGVEPATTIAKELKQAQPDREVTPELLMSNSCPDSYSNSDSNSDADADSDADPNSHTYAEAVTTTVEAPDSPAAQQRRFEDLKHKVRAIFGDSQLYQAFLVDGCNQHGLDALESALNEAMSKGYKQWKDILDILRKKARAKPKSLAPPAELSS